MSRRKKEPDPPPKPPRRPRGTGTITVLKDGRIRARLPANIDPKRKAKEFRPGQMAEAIAWLDSFLHPPAIAPVAAVTVSEWALHWHATYIEPIHPYTTTRRVLYSLKQLEPLYAVPVADVRPSMLQACVGTLAARLVAETVQGIVGDWRRCFEAAADDGLIVRNPARKLATPRSVPKEAKRHVTPQEVALLWPEIGGERFEAAYALMIGCGLRIGEVLGLHWANVDMAGSRIWVQHQWTNSRMRDTPKGRNPHWTHLPERVRVALIRHRDRQPEGSVLVMQTPHVNHHGPRRKPKGPATPRPWSDRAVRNDLVALIRRMELDPVTPHAFRRGLVTALLDGGASPAVVADRVGHRNTATTLNHYAKLSPEATQRADELVGAYLGGPILGDSGGETDP